MTLIKTKSKNSNQFLRVVLWGNVHSRKLCNPLWSWILTSKPNSTWCSQWQKRMNSEWQKSEWQNRIQSPAPTHYWFALKLREVLLLTSVLKVKILSWYLLLHKDSINFKWMFRALLQSCLVFEVVSHISLGRKLLLLCQIFLPFTELEI